MKPTRVQLKRTKGWRMPANTVKVDRSTRWGNPFKITHSTVDIDPYCSTATARKKLPRETAARWSVDSYRDWLPDDAKQKAKAELRGKNLACWCPLDQPCHADILLELANE